MIFLNFNYLTLFIFFLLIIIWGVFLRWFYFKQKNKISILFLFLALLFLIINIFEIKWWFKNWIEKTEWWKVVFALDVSKSMQVQDIKNNNIFFTRLVWSKEIIKKYISENRNNDYWLIIFAWETVEVLPFTNDLDIFNTILYWVSDLNIPRLWTNLNSVFSSLENYFVSEEDWWLVVIFSDLWEEKININKEQLEKLKNKWVKILLVWVGTDKWWKILTWKDLFWREIYKLYNWEEVISKLNIRELNRISKEYYINKTVFDDINDFELISDFITKEVTLINLKKSVYNRIDLTRIFTFLSFIFFILFLYTENFSWKRK